MKELYTRLLHSFDNTKLGFSAKKLTIATIVGCVVVSHYMWWKTPTFEATFSNVLIIDFGFIATLFGINVTDKKINADTKATE